MTQNNIFTALLLVVSVLLFFMGTRNSFGCARHSVVDVDQLCNLDILGFTLNMVVPFSLILALGMLVQCDCGCRKYLPALGLGYQNRCGREGNKGSCSGYRSIHSDHHRSVLPDGVLGRNHG